MSIENYLKEVRSPIWYCDRALGVILKPITDFSATVGKYSGAIAQGLPMSIENYLKEVRSPILSGAIALLCYPQTHH